MKAIKLRPSRFISKLVCLRTKEPNFQRLTEKAAKSSMVYVNIMAAKICKLVAADS